MNLPASVVMAHLRKWAITDHSAFEKLRAFDSTVCYYDKDAELKGDAMEQDRRRTGVKGSYHLLGLAFWQAWWMTSMCTDIVLPSPPEASFPGTPSLWVMVMTTAAYLVVMLFSKNSPCFPPTSTTSCLQVSLPHLAAYQCPWRCSISMAPRVLRFSLLATLFYQRETHSFSLCGANSGARWQQAVLAGICTSLMPSRSSSSLQSAFCRIHYHHLLRRASLEYRLLCCGHAALNPGVPLRLFQYQKMHYPSATLLPPFFW